MRVALIIDAWEYPYSGAVISARRFSQTLTKRDFEFSVLCAEGGEAPLGEVDTIRFPILSLPGYNGTITRMKFSLASPDRSVVRRALQNVDILHCQLPSALGVTAMQEARRLGTPVVWTYHLRAESVLWNMGFVSRTLSKSIRHLARAVQGFAIQEIFNRADLVIAPTSFALRLARRDGLTAPGRVISNGVPNQFFVEPGPRSGGRFRVMCVGRFGYEKGHETLFRAVRLSAHHNQIDLMLAGTGPLRGNLERLARRLAVKVVFEWLDQPRLIECLRAADLVVHPSTIETEGISVLEAMATGSAVLIADSKDSASTAFATHRDALFKPGDAVDLAQKIDFWLKRDEERLNLGRANQRLARHYSHEESADALADLYREYA